MTLGHTAWQGYLTHGRGLLACKVAVTERALPSMSIDFMRDNARYVLAAEVAACLNRHDLKADIANRLISKVQTYCPNQEILVFMERKGEITISLLTNLAISPPNCYQQVCNRWEEFYLEPRSAGKSS